VQLSEDQLDAFTVVLGDLIRTERKSRGWTRKQLRVAMFPELAGDEQALDNVLSIQTLATYELGTRKILVTRLVHICAALEVSVGDLVRRTLERLHPAVATGSIFLDRAGLADSADPRLHSLKQWLATQSQQPDDNSLVVELPREALDPLADLARLTKSELTSALAGLVIDRS
jgi:transcriptional regulator with XRE-family HTH domain